MVDIYVRLDTGHGETGAHVPKMNPELWDKTLDEVTGETAGNIALDPDLANMKDRTDEEKVAGTASGYSSKTGGWQEKDAKAAAKAEADAAGEPYDGTVDESLRTTEAESEGAMTEKPITAPALKHGDTSLPEGDGSGGTADNITMQSSPTDTSRMTDEERATAEDQMSEQAQADARQSSASQTAGEGDAAKRNADTTTKTGADGKDMPSRSALMAMSREDLEKFAKKNNVDPEGATKQQIVDTLYE